MPRVPTYDNNVPNVIEKGAEFGGPAQNVAPSFDYQSVMNRAMQPINRAAETITKIEAHYRDTAIKANADEQLDAFNREVQDTLFSPEGYFNQKGKNAVDQWDASQQKLQEIYNKHASAIEDDATRQAFTSSALPQVRTIRQRSIDYRNRQGDSWRADASKAHLNSLTNQFALAGFGDGSRETFDSMMNEIEYQGKLAGQSTEWIEQQKEAQSSLAYATAYSVMAQEDPEAALRHFQTQGRKIMTPAVAQKTFSALFTATQKQIENTLLAMGGTTSLSLTGGAVMRTHEGGTQPEGVDNSKLIRQRNAQQGLGTPPKATNTVLNTSGYKGCNPLNIRAGGDKWTGLVGQTDKGYAVFSSPVEGIRAAGKIIQTYSNKYGIDTVEGIISRFAPSSENPTNAYIKNVCKETGFKPDEKLNLKEPETLGKLLQAMMKQEIGGVPYSDETINTGILAALGREDVRDYSDLYNTKLTPEEESQYQEWAKRIGHEKDVYDYDLRGAWKAGAQQAENGHFPDTFKKPNHHTFSNESQYHNGTTRIGGHWEVRDGANVFVGANNELKDDNGKPIQTAEVAPQPSARLTAQDLVFNPDVKTGYDVFDNLPRAYKFKILKEARQKADASRASGKNELALILKNALAQARETGDTSAIPDETAFIRVYGPLEGTDRFRDAQRQGAFNANLFLMPSMSLAEMNSMTKQLTPDKGDPHYAARIEERDLWVKALNQTQKARGSDPMLYGMQAYPELQLAPINDWTNQREVTGQIARRMQGASVVANRFGTPEALFTNEEIKTFLGHMQTMDAEHQAAYLQNLSETMVDPRTGSGRALEIFSDQIGEKNRTIAIALGVASTEKGKDINSAQRQMQGAYYRNQHIGLGFKDESAIRQKLSGVLVYADGSPQSEAMVQAVINEHCYANATEAQTVDKSIENVFGIVTDYNGGKIFLPTRLEKAQKDFWTFTNVGSFKDLLEDAGKDFEKSGKKYTYAGRQISGSQLSLLITSGRLKTIRDGEYLIQDGLRYVTDNGTPVVINLNKYIDKRLKR